MGVCLQVFCFFLYACVYVCVSVNSVSVDLPVGIPRPFNSYTRGMLNLPLPLTSLPFPFPSHSLHLPSSVSPFATTSPPTGGAFDSRMNDEIVTTIIHCFKIQSLVAFDSFVCIIYDCFHLINNASTQTYSIIVHHI